MVSVDGMTCAHSSLCIYFLFFFLFVHHPHKTPRAHWNIKLNMPPVRYFNTFYAMTQQNALSTTILQKTVRRCIKKCLMPHSTSKWMVLFWIVGKSHEASNQPMFRWFSLCHLIWCVCVCVWKWFSWMWPVPRGPWQWLAIPHISKSFIHSTWLANPINRHPRGKGAILYMTWTGKWRWEETVSLHFPT